MLLADTMQLHDFEASLHHEHPPQGLAPALHVLWLDRRGDWDGAHDIAQDLPDPEGSVLHAYLHRKEGDLGNAGYWYRRAGEPMPRDALEAEWQRLVARFTQPVDP